MSTAFLNVRFLAIFWFLLSLFFCNTNDVLGKYLGQNLPSIEVTFLRFFCSALVLLPFIAFKGLKVLKTQNKLAHIFRGLLIAGAIGFWFAGLGAVPITTATTISFSMPLFTLVLARIFLKEHITWQRYLATLIGFAGVVIVLEPTSLTFNPSALYMLVSAFVFAILDIINKKYICVENMFCMLFYPAVVAALVVAGPAIKVWVAPSMSQIRLLLILSCGSNLVLFCILKAFSLAEASFLAPFRYTELIISSLFGIFVFHEWPSQATLMGSVVIIISTLYVALSENKTKKQTSKGQKVASASKAQKPIRSK
jgi:S-adenosylmethionine uptake transporter